METLKEIPWQAEKEAFEAIAQIGSYETMTEEDRNRYDKALRNYRDSVAVYEAAKEEGIQEEKARMALTMMLEGVSVDLIARITQLPEAEIRRLCEQGG